MAATDHSPPCSDCVAAGCVSAEDAATLRGQLREARESLQSALGELRVASIEAERVERADEVIATFGRLIDLAREGSA